RVPYSLFWIWFCSGQADLPSRQTPHVEMPNAAIEPAVAKNGRPARPSLLTSGLWRPTPPARTGSAMGGEPAFTGTIALPSLGCIFMLEGPGHPAPDKDAA